MYTPYKTDLYTKDLNKKGKNKEKKNVYYFLFTTGDNRIYQSSFF